MRLSIDSLQHLHDFFSPYATSRGLPSFASGRQTARPALTIVQDLGLPIRRRSRWCRSQERLRSGASWEVKARHRWRRVRPQTDRASQLSEKRSAKAGPLIGYIAILGLIPKIIQRKSWSNMPPKLLACIGFLYNVVHKIGPLKVNRACEIEFNFLNAAWTISMKF